MGSELCFAGPDEIAHWIETYHIKLRKCQFSMQPSLFFYSCVALGQAPPSGCEYVSLWIDRAVCQTDA